ncbi:hypothetical protein VCR12J2_620419 [Vibrio coralliirubri]|nr:hypothetical protein VCR29J2_360302 [Vibrio coralliirubri]CDT76111.1 hypothetical protein VCR26J2_370251 [Vibrio coralliirubri]CDU00956.1 hypothetical protein VCR12J2_620419 [Vibrio coralliirubri]
MLHTTKGRKELEGVYSPITVADWKCPQLKSIHKERTTSGFSLFRSRAGC